MFRLFESVGPAELIGPVVSKSTQEICGLVLFAFIEQLWQVTRKIFMRALARRIFP